MRGTLAERLWTRVDKNAPAPEHAPELGPCWVYTGAIVKTTGYGVITIGGRDEGRDSTHRVAYKLVKGEVPEGMDLDHLCRNRPCCNPAHLEPVTRKVNLLRGDTIPARNKAKTHCPKGHAFATDGSYSYKNGRQCPTCVKARSMNRYYNKKNQTACH